MKRHFAWVVALVMLFSALSILANADIAVKQGNLALFLKPTWSTGKTTAGHWTWTQRQDLLYVPGTKSTGHGGRKFYQYEDSAGDGVLYSVASAATGLPQGYRHKGTVVVAEIGWGKQTPLTAQDVWAIWEGIPDTYKNRKQGVTQIQLLSDELFGTCYDLDNKYGSRDLRILVYGAELTNDAEEDKKIVEAQIIRALNGKGLETRQR